MARPRKRNLLVAIPLATLLAACGSTVADQALEGQDQARGPGDSLTTSGGTTGGATGIDQTTGMPVSATTGGSTGTGSSGTTGFTGTVGGTTTGGTTTGTTVATQPIKVGVVVPYGNAGAILGVDATETPPEQAEAEVRALIKGINARHGFGGRKVNVVFVRQDRTDEGAATMTRIQNEVCTALTEDHKVDFVITLANAFTSYSNECYVRHRMPIFSVTVGTEDDWKRNRPWFMPQFGLNISRMARLLPIGLAEQKFMTQKMGVVTFDRNIERDAVKRHLLPGLAAKGGKVLETVYVPLAYNEIAAQTASAVLRFKQLGIDRVVMFAPGGGEWGVFAQNAQSQNYHPKYGISSLDSPNAIGALLVPPEQLPGTKGVGGAPAIDVAPSKRPPMKKVARECWDYLNKNAGTSYNTDDIPGILAWARCEFIWAAEAGFRAMLGQPYRKENILASFFAVRGSYDSILLPKATFKLNVVDVADGYAHLVWDETCDCFRYASPFKPINV